MKTKAKKGLTALVLGGGAARGMAHIGVLEVFEKAGLEFDMIVGTSMGALVGGLYAAGAQLEEIERAIVDMPWKRVVSYFRLNLKGGGLVDGKAVVKALETILADTKIEDFPVRFAAVSVDVRTGERVVLQTGSAVTAIRASISVPGAFMPVMDGGRALVDGGVMEPVPAPTARELGATCVIAVNVLDHPAKRHLTGKWAHHAERKDRDAPSRRTAASRGQWRDKILAFTQKIAHKRRERRAKKGTGPWLGSVLWNSMRIIQYSLSEYQMREADVVVEPDLGDVLPSEFYRGKECIEAGRKAARQALPDVLKALGKA